MLIVITQTHSVTPTSSGTFSHSPLVTAAFSSASFLAGFCLSFLLNENERNDKNRFFDFSFFTFLALSVAGVAAASSPVSTTSLLSFNVVAVVSLTFSVSLPLSATSAVFSSDFGDETAGASPAAPFSVASTAAEWSSFSVALSFAFSASSLSVCFGSPTYLPKKHIHRIQSINSTFPTLYNYNLSTSQKQNMIQHLHRLPCDLHHRSIVAWVDQHLRFCPMCRCPRQLHYPLCSPPLWCQQIVCFEPFPFWFDFCFCCCWIISFDVN